MQGCIIRFAEFELDTTRYELRRSGRALRLEKLPMELLILLSEKPGQLVTREEIIQRLWGDNVFVDTRQGITLLSASFAWLCGITQRDPASCKPSWVRVIDCWLSSPWRRRYVRSRPLRKLRLYPQHNAGYLG